MTFSTRFWGELVVKRIEEIDDDHTKIEISLSTLSPSTLQKISETNTTTTEELKPPLATILGVKSDQIVGVGEYEMVQKSLIIELSPEVDLESLKVDPKALVSLPSTANSGWAETVAEDSPGTSLSRFDGCDADDPGRVISWDIEDQYPCFLFRVYGRSRCKSPLSRSLYFTSHSRLAMTMANIDKQQTGAAHAFITGYYLLTPASSRIPSNVVHGQPVESIKIDGRQLSRRGGRLGMELAEGGMVKLTGVAVEWGKGSLSA